MLNADEENQEKESKKIMKKKLTTKDKDHQGKEDYAKLITYVSLLINQAKNGGKNLRDCLDERQSQEENPY